MKIKITDKQLKMLIENNIKSNNLTITFLIGPPASGKSTWTSKYGKDSIVISRDDIVDRLRQGTNMSYSDTFRNNEFQKKVNIELQNHISNTLNSNKNIIVDMTNMSKKSRTAILSRVPKEYTKNAVVFNVDREELIKRLKKIEMETGKKVGIDIVDNMINSFEMPDYNEFDNIEII